MAGECSDPLLLTKRAGRMLKGPAAPPVPGVVTLSQRRLRWAADDPSAGAPPAAVDLGAAPRQQKVSGKPFLRLAPPGGAPLDLAFESEADRDEVLDFLRQLVARPPAAGGGGAGGGPGSSPAAAGGVLLPTDEQRRALFAADRDLEVVHGQLVGGGALSDADFWAARQPLVRAARAGGGAAGALGGTEAAAPASLRQRPGLSSVMFRVARSADDAAVDRVRVTLTAADIQRLFTERPEVHRAFLAAVPARLTEAAFWEHFFRLEYRREARRARAVAAGRTELGDADLEDDDDVVAPHARALAARAAAARAAALAAADPGVNLAADALGEALGDGYGTAHGGAPDAWAAGGAGAGGGGARPALAARRSAAADLFAEVNRHGAAVLAGAPDARVAAAAAAPGATSATIAAAVAAAAARAAEAGGGAAAAGGGGGDDAERAAAFRRRAESGLEDLRLEEAPRVEPLAIPDPRLYFDRGVDGAKGQAGGGGGGGDDDDDDDDAGAKGAGAREAAALAAAAAALAEIDAAALSAPPVDPAAAAAAALELGADQDAALVAEFGPVAATVLGAPPGAALGGVMVEFFRAEALKTAELLRHFWGAVPAATAARRAKAERLAPHLAAQRAALAAHEATHPGTAGQVYAALMLRPLLAALDAGLARWEVEKAAGRGGGGG